MDTIDPSTYAADAEDLNELARLVRQDRGLSTLLQPVYQGAWSSRVRQVLDIACGPGGWSLDMGRLYPRVHFTGVDKSIRMLEYARLLAQAETVRNVEFVEMDVLKGLLFADGLFDFVNGRLMYSFLNTSWWPFLLGEVYRVLRSGGKAIITDYETGYSNSSAIEKLSALLTEAGYKHGGSFSPSGRSSGFSPVIKGLLRDAGFRNVSHQVVGIDGSYGEPGYEVWREDLFLMSKTFRPFVVRSGLMAEQDIEALLQQALEDMSRPSFRMMSFLFIAQGEK